MGLIAHECDGVSLLIGHPELEVVDETRHNTKHDRKNIRGHFRKIDDLDAAVLSGKVQ